MPIQIQGNGGTAVEVSGTGFRAMRIEQRPIEYGSLGQYSAAHLSGTMAAGLAANAEVFQYRWTDATRLALVNKVWLDGLSGSATAFTAGFAKVDLLFSRSWTADGSGGTAMTITGNNQKLRTSMGTMLVGAIRGSSTAALTAGTKTNDSQSLGLFAFSIGTVANVIYAPNRIELFDSKNHQSHPVVLAQNEGLSARATVPATGTWQFGMSIGWTEVASY